MAAHAAHQTKVLAKHELPSVGDPRTRGKRLGHFVHKVIRGRERPARTSVVERLPAQIFEQRDSAGRPARRERLVQGDDQLRGTVALDESRPLADAPVMRRLTGLRGAELIGITKNNHPMVAGDDPKRAEKMRHLDALNTTFVVKMRGEGRPERVVLMGYNTMDHIRQANALGQPVQEPEQYGAAVIQRGQAVQLGRKPEDSWAPYQSVRDWQQDDPEYARTADRLRSRKQTLVTFDSEGRVFVADGDGESRSNNGTHVIYGSPAEERTTVISAQQGLIYGAEPTGYLSELTVRQAPVAETDGDPWNSGAETHRFGIPAQRPPLESTAPQHYAGAHSTANHN